MISASTIFLAREQYIAGKAMAEGVMHLEEALTPRGLSFLQVYQRAMGGGALARPAGAPPNGRA